MNLHWIVLLPLVGFLINGIYYALFKTRKEDAHPSAVFPGIIATAAILGSFVFSVKVFIGLAGGGHDGAQLYTQHLFDWIAVGDLKLGFDLRVDHLSSLFTLVITGVGTLIHLYSIGYMAHDKAPGKFFAYLNLFCFSMLMLVMGSSLPLLFLGWEGVGLCSYLLIGFWFTDLEKAKAGKKAFIVNRVGDLGFLLGMFIIYYYFGSLDFDYLAKAFSESGVLEAIPSGVITLATLLLFLGCTGKSAQIPLFIWLPDAMAGPTPVSALIHAATMVTSGVYLLARLSPLFVAAPITMAVIAVVGALTAFFAASIALVQNDIKKVLAYSTVSQLGYMFLSCGVGAFVGGVFHVITHAFFKALLFLGAGSVIHGMNEEQDIQKMGGLRKAMPVTFATFLVGWLAICGVPGLSGFFSKDEILFNAFASPHGNKFLWFMGALTAMMTAFYMTRLFYLVFLGAPRSTVHAHESSASMTLPLIILGGLSAVGGFLGIPAVFAEHAHWLDHWLSPVVKTIPHDAFKYGHIAEWVLMAISSFGAVFAIILAFKTYGNLKVPESLKNRYQSAHRVLMNKWYVDELYEYAFIKPIYRLSQRAWTGFDIAVIDRFVLGFGRISQWSGQAARSVHTGALQTYILLLLIGLIATLGYLIYAMA